MGKRGPMPKPADKVMGHRKRPVSRTPPAQLPVPIIPTPNAEWRAVTIEAWRVYWVSDLAKIVLDVDTPSIVRLFDLYDQHHRAMEVVRRALVVKGSTGQLRTNPLADHGLRLEGVILRLENELGLTPMARSRLGITLTRAQLERDEAPPPGGRYAHLRSVG